MHAKLKERSLETGLMQESLLLTDSPFHKWKNQALRNGLFEIKVESEEVRQVDRHFVKNQDRSELCLRENQDPILSSKTKRI